MKLMYTMKDIHIIKLHHVINSRERGYYCVTFNDYMHVSHLLLQQIYEILHRNQQKVFFFKLFTVVFGPKSFFKLRFLQ